jgi:peroxiredoxin
MTANAAPGDPAHDFELPLVDGGGTVRLSSFAGTRPVALVFGSYT